jgi:hypothetical protein
MVIDCHEALRINRSIYANDLIPNNLKQYHYVRADKDFPSGQHNINWTQEIGYNPEDPEKFLFSATFARYTAMIFCIAGNFDYAETEALTGYPYRLPAENLKYKLYRPDENYRNAVKADYEPLQVATVVLEFGYVRVFDWYLVGQIYTKQAVDTSAGNAIIESVKDALALYFHPTNQKLGIKPKLQEIIKIVENAHPQIENFDPGNIGHSAITWDTGFDADRFNTFSFARYIKSSNTDLKFLPLQIASECIVRNLT